MTAAEPVPGGDGRAAARDDATVPDAGGAAPARTPLGLFVAGGARLLAALPEGPLVAAAEAAGELWYRLAPGRAAQARANLRRVCTTLAERGRGSDLVRRAANDPAALELLVRRTFRHAVRYYLEVARISRFDLAGALARIDVETPGEVRDALGSGQPVVIVGMHYGAIELPTIVVSSMVGHEVTAPMEAVRDPGLQHWFVASRSRVGVRIVPIVDARRTLLRALRGGESVGLVADRDIMGNGIPVPFCGAPAPIPAGPALLALEAGVPVYVGCARRTRGGHYAGRLIRVPEPPEGPRRERMVAYTAGIAAAFEAILEGGPEQWWGAFHPIWPDLVVGAGGAA